MVDWHRVFFGSEGSRRDELESLLPRSRNDLPPSAFPAKEVMRVALRLKHQIEEVIPCELEEARVTTAHSSIITPAVVKCAREAGGKEYRSCVVFCLLICKRWFKRMARLELWDAEMHNVRAVACEVIGKAIIEQEEDMDYLLQDVLLKRYSIIVDGEATTPANVVEKAVDLHALRVIGSSGYQKCISYLWKGWLVQDDEDPSTFVAYTKRANTNYWSHFDPDRMRVPLYQNVVQIAISIVYLALYTGVVNTVNPSGDLDVVEGLLYIFTLGFVCDELSKLWKVGRYYVGFWNVFNSTLYALLVVSFVLRMVALAHPLDSDGRGRFNELSYNFLAVTAPMFWGRLLLYLDTARFFGTMLVVLKVMMRESAIFFILLFVIGVGFLQAFIGLDQVDNNLTATGFVVKEMINALMGSPEFDGFDNFGHPFGLVLYYIYCFVIMVVLLNILIALYNSAYEDITDNADDEYMALFAQKTMQFVRAPDENVFIPPFNLIEMFFLILPLEWWLSEKTYSRINDYVMGVIYSPLLLVTAAMETRSAHRVRVNKRRGVEEDDDDEVIEEWEQDQVQDLCDFESDGWGKKVEDSKPNVEIDMATSECRRLRAEVNELKDMIKLLLKEKGRDGEVNGQ
ncbi:uncharacterized protein PV09_00910 [Verruconis gallopava]|uniref:Uncharacterized protein n=1 Tax=Verruconis gallopava TaxID=253628 RepID=A0A0D2BCE7_9PEZI|nr:uncharacterized protein PV09_00910 [Verruconis gallopava]KIW09014.1 hypothetical protein PV09_00910 [Verruconis gallopava]